MSGMKTGKSGQNNGTLPSGTQTGPKTGRTTTETQTSAMTLGSQKTTPTLEKAKKVVGGAKAVVRAKPKAKEKASPKEEHHTASPKAVAGIVALHAT